MKRSSKTDLQPGKSPLRYWTLYFAIPFLWIHLTSAVSPLEELAETPPSCGGLGRSSSRTATLAEDGLPTL